MFSAMQAVNVRLQWTTPLREFLCDCVRARDKLWKKVNATHDNDVRQDLWDEIARDIKLEFEIDVDNDDMKRTWKNLKDSYVRMRRIYETAPEKVSKWRFFHALQFLDRAEVAEDSDYQEELVKRVPQKRSQMSALFNEENIETEPMGKRYNRKRYARATRIQLLAQDKQIRMRNEREASDEPTENDESMIQVAFPELDRHIVTKQIPPMTLMSFVVDDGPDTENISLALNKYWYMETTETAASSAQTDLIEAILELVDLPASDDDKINDDWRRRIGDTAQRLREEFNSATLKQFLFHGMSQTDLNAILRAFDNFVFNDDPITLEDSVRQVVNTCDDRLQAAFALLFNTIKSYRGQLHLPTPTDSVEVTPLSGEILRDMESSSPSTIASDDVPAEPKEEELVASTSTTSDETMPKLEQVPNAEEFEDVHAVQNDEKNELTETTEETKNSTSVDDSAQEAEGLEGKSKLSSAEKTKPTKDLKNKVNKDLDTKIRAVEVMEQDEEVITSPRRGTRLRTRSRFCGDNAATPESPITRSGRASTDSTPQKDMGRMTRSKKRQS